MTKNAQIYREFEDIANAIDELSENRSLLIVGVSGLGGSGKSTLCRRLSEHFSGRAFHFECDLFAKHGTVERRKRIADALNSGDPVTIEQEENPKNWYGWDDIEKTLEGLRRKGSYVFSHGWNQQTGEKDKEAVFQLPNHDHPVLLVDCIYLLHDPVRNWFDLSIFVDTPLDVTFERGKQRDKHRSDPSYLEYKRSLTYKYDEPYFEEHKNNADWVYVLK